MGVDLIHHDAPGQHALSRTILFPDRERQRSEVTTSITLPYILHKSLEQSSGVPCIYHGVTPKTIHRTRKILPSVSYFTVIQ